MAAVVAGAEWRIGAGAFHNSGATVANLGPTNVTVSFKAIPGWKTPFQSDCQGMTRLRTTNLLAAYVDTNRPVLSITFPAPNQRWSNNMITVSRNRPRQCPNIQRVLPRPTRAAIGRQPPPRTAGLMVDRRCIFDTKQQHLPRLLPWTPPATVRPPTKVIFVYVPGDTLAVQNQLLAERSHPLTMANCSPSAPITQSPRIRAAIGFSLTGSRPAKRRLCFQCSLSCILP